MFRKKTHSAPRSRSIVDSDGVVLSSIDDQGHEVLDDTPVAVPVEMIRAPSMFEQMRAMVRSEVMARYAQENEMETFEESEDFDVGDDFDPSSPWENEFDPPLAEIHEEVKASRKKPDQAPPPEPKE
ncbi:MAG: hypothetical protein [Arizlama microvirus]|nr:MAG: hypothetical protein [Arizlama microvirus]